MTNEPHLGIDFGGVIIPMDRRTRAGDTGFSERFLSTHPQTGAIEKIRSLVTELEGNVWIVSKCGPRTEALTMQWFQDRDFFRLTGMEESRVRFCRERPQKKPVCADLRITHFVDDREHIMQILRGTVGSLYLFGDKSSHRAARRWTTLVEDWTEAHDVILRDLQKLNRSYDSL